jgi:hypothetical protein
MSDDRYKYRREQSEHNLAEDADRIRGLQQENAALRREINQLRGKNPMHLLGYLTGWEVKQSREAVEVSYLGDPDRLASAESNYTIVHATFAIPRKDSEVATNMFRSGLHEKTPDTYLESMAAEKDKLAIELDKSTREKEDLLVLAEKMRGLLERSTSALTSLADQACPSSELPDVMSTQIASVRNACVAISESKSALTHDLSQENIRRFGESFWERHRKLERAVEEKKIEISARLITELDKEDQKCEW